jgi:hypothetical protein
LVSKANSYGSFRILKDYSEMDRVLVAEKS